MGKDLKYENLAISIPSKGCNKNCPYCVSRMTGYIEPRCALFMGNIEKVKTVARTAEITSILVTGKGEPLLNLPMVTLIGRCFENWPLEIQTNGVLLTTEIVGTLLAHRYDVIAVSMDCPRQFVDLAPVLSFIHESGGVSRITVNITTLLQTLNFKYILDYCKRNHIRQLTLRKIVCPENPKDAMTARWIDENAPESLYDTFLCDAKEYIEKSGKLLRKLSYGVEVWDLDGIAFSYSDYCIQERNEGDNGRSLVYLEDGHLYTSWNSPASILF